MARGGFYIGSQRVPGVTTIISSLGWNTEVLNQWAFNEGKRAMSKLLTEVIYKGEKGGYSTEDVVNQVMTKAEGLTLNVIRDKAKDEGICLHDMIDCFVKQKEFNESAYASKTVVKMRRGFDKFRSYIQETGLQFTNTEFDVLSQSLLYGARVDFEAREDGAVIIGDTKTGKGVYTDHIVQLAGCFFAYSETYGTLPQKAIVLVINKDTGDLMRADLTRDVLNWGYEVLKILRNLYEMKKSEPKIFGKKI